MRTHAHRILALKELGWTWDMVADHFFGDGVLGNSSGDSFCKEWSLLRRQGLEIDIDEVERLVRELTNMPEVSGFWVKPSPRRSDKKSFVSSDDGFSESAEAVPEVKDTAAVPVASSAERRRLIGAKPVPVARPEGSVVERHQLSASAVGVSNKFAGPAKPEASEGVPAASSEEAPEAEFSDWIPSGPPVEISAASRKVLEDQMFRGAGTLRTEHMISYLDLPHDLAVLAPAALRRYPLSSPTVDVLIGALIYAHSDSARFRSALARLPGASRWIRLLKSGVFPFEEAAARAKEEDKQKREGGDK